MPQWLHKSAALDWLRLARIGARVPAYCTLSWAAWVADPAGELGALRRRFAGLRLAVRSDRMGEDAGHAGSFLSLTDVPAEGAALESAIRRVFASYGDARPGDRVLVQRYVKNAAMAGVAASRALPLGEAYQVYSWVHSSPNSAVTGAASQCWTAYDYAGTTPGLARPAPPLIARLRALLDTIKAACGGEIEIEWLWKHGRLHIVQLRELRIQPSPAQDRELGRRLRVASRALTRSCTDAPEGELLGLMPDWNPAELLGAHPRPLALDVFAHLITNRSFSEARAALGYADTPGALLAPIAGRPYVRVSRSLHSLLPRALDAHARTAIVDTQLARLQAQPQLHDRVEFEIATSSFEFGQDWRTRLDGLPRGTVDLLAAALRAQVPQLFDVDALHREQERSRFALRQHLRWPTPDAPLADWWRVLEQLRRRHAVSFAQSARRCFALEALLRSAVREGACQLDELQRWRSDAAHLQAVLARGCAESTPWREALRPGTFEITHLRYGDWQLPPQSGGEPKAQRSHLTPATAAALDRLGRTHGLALDAQTLFRGFALAHQARDWGKLALSVELSHGLEALAAMAARRGLGRAALSWLRAGQLKDDRAASWDAHVAAAEKRHAADALLRMPPLLSASSELTRVILAPGAPVYLGHGRVHARVHAIDAHSTPQSLPAGAIVVMERCEPGFDWIFLRQPAAIVTAFGGPNAHVALRAHEVDCPALLGVGLDACARIVRCDALDIDFELGWWRPALAPVPRGSGPGPDALQSNSVRTRSEPTQSTHFDP